jgi:preprotein translocase subunit YajC
MGGAQAQLLNLMPIILIFVVFYFLLIRPQKKAQDDHKKMVAALKKNDEVMTSGGIHGVIVNVKDATVMLRVDDNVKIEVQKSSISVVKKKGAE